MSNLFELSGIPKLAQLQVHTPDAIQAMPPVFVGHDITRWLYANRPEQFLVALEHSGTVGKLQLEAAFWVLKRTDLVEKYSNALVSSRTLLGKTANVIRFKKK